VVASGAFGMVSITGSSTDSGTTATESSTAATYTTTAPTDTTARTDTSPTTTTDTTPTTTASPQIFSPSITSDQADYHPGATVTLTGAGWGPGEAVHIFVNDDVGQTWSYNADVTADSSG